ncbi:GNAT family N-acetyltransferase [Paenibacillus sepulcri]|uniref:GNAT family N-acetyltransferase n=1 Tax=Paenibacillus sepulcri TaxID=359917 RepID=A0ABS7C4N7_9BACL|nr:GNAT family N-acetyltransferase [Paenibacillus sepulcri]
MENATLLLVTHSRMESERILLRPVSLKDAEDMFEYTSDEETTRFIYAQHQDLNKTKQVIANYFVKEALGKYAIVLKDSDKMIGTIEFRVHEANQSGELGFTLSRQHWGKGYMTEAGQLILALAFDVLGLERVFAMHDVNNPASGKVMIRLGMTYEGTLRRNHVANGVFADSANYSILKEEYGVNS